MRWLFISSSNIAKTEKYNGTSWTEISDLNTASYEKVWAGQQTAALEREENHPGSFKPEYVESWDGSSWTEVNEINTAREKARAAGTYTAGLFYGGLNTYPRWL